MVEALLAVELFFPQIIFEIYKHSNTNSMIIAPGSVEEPASTQHGAVRQVEPQVGGEVALVALPA